MDFAYGPAGRSDDFIKIFGDFYSNRANTTLLTTLTAIGSPSLESLATHLDDLPTAQKPIGDLFICSHGNESGWLEIRLTSILPVQDVDFAALLQWHSRLELAAATTTPAAAGQVGTTVRFRACRIGQSEPFMQLLKAGFGGRVRVSASKHFFSYGSGHLSGQDVAFEYLDYGFVVRRPNTKSQRLKSRSQAVKAFRDAGFKYYTGQAIPNTKWGQWMPRKAPKHKTRRTMRARLAAGEPRFDLGTQFRAEAISAPDAIPFTGNQPNQATARARAVSHLQTLEQYKTDWPPGRPAGVPPYPVHAENGFTTLEAFVAAHHWRVGKVGDTSGLIGSRMEYTLLVPIFDPATSLVLHNLVPTNTTGPPAPRVGLDETNVALFWNQ